MLFSIVIPVHNSEKYLQECLESVYGQSVSDFEVVVVDDGSVDGSGHIADEYAIRHGNMRVLHTVNQGPFLARREGLRRCMGDYVVFLDSDDALSQDALKTIGEVIKETDPDIVSFRFSRNECFSTADDVEFIPCGFYKNSNYNQFKQAICSAQSNSLWGKAIRLCRIDLDAGYEALEGSMLAEDLLQLIPIVDSSKSFVRIDDVLYFYRPNESSTTSNFKEKYIDDTEQVSICLLDYGARWGMVNDALLGVSKLYIGLGKILADSVKRSLSVSEAKKMLVRMRASLLVQCPTIVKDAPKLRIDQQLILNAVIAADLSKLRLVTSASHLGRRMLGRSI